MNEFPCQINFFISKIVDEDEDMRKIMLISFIYRVEYMLEMNEQEFIGLWETAEAYLVAYLRHCQKFIPEHSKNRREIQPNSSKLS